MGFFAANNRLAQLRELGHRVEYLACVIRSEGFFPLLAGVQESRASSTPGRKFISNDDATPVNAYDAALARTTRLMSHGSVQECHVFGEFLDIVNVAPQLLLESAYRCEATEPALAATALIWR
jgi:hypothetical protein